MSTKHTPGPWVVGAMGGQAVSPRDGFLISASDSLGVRSDVAWIRNCPTLSPEELVANARLIAAAPELLEALRWMVARFAPGDEGLGKAEMASAERARAAIAKAEGK